MAENSTEYIRKDVFDARMDRMEMLLEKTVTEMKSYVDSAISEMKTETQKAISEMKTEMQQTREELKIEIDGVKTDLNKTRTELKAEIHDVGNEVKVLTARVDSLENVFYWGLGGFGIILASAVIFPAIMGFLKKLFTPSLTVEDVERIVNAAISRHLSNNVEVR